MCRHQMKNCSSLNTSLHGQVRTHPETYMFQTLPEPHSRALKPPCTERKRSSSHSCTLVCLLKLLTACTHIVEIIAIIVISVVFKLC